MAREPARVDALFDRALGAYLGLALGDALGATVEFMTTREIAHRFAAQGGVHRRIVGGGWLNLAPGQVTDDTTMSLALGDALLQGFRAGRPFDAHLIAQAYARWLRDKPVDCGNTCRRGIRRFLNDGSVAGSPNPADGGNGALMRNLPVLLATLDDDDAFERASLAQAHVTHHHPLSDAAVVGLGRVARALLAGGGDAAARDAIDALVARWPKFRFRPWPGRASGYVVDTVQTVLHDFTTQCTFESAVVAAVNHGDDADTNGALVGMLAGARCGARGLPGCWLRRLNRDVVRAVTEQTVALLAAGLAHAGRAVPTTQHADANGT